VLHCPVSLAIGAIYHKDMGAVSPVTLVLLEFFHPDLSVGVQV